MAIEDKNTTMAPETSGPTMPVTNTDEATAFGRGGKAFPLLIAIGVVLIAVVAYFGYDAYMDSRDEEAQKEMFNAQYAFESDSLNNALNGFAGNKGFLDIIDDYSGTDAANLAHFYTGAIYLKQGEFAKAAEHLKEYSSDDILIQARAYALTGDAYMEQQQYGEAANWYKKAADHKPNKQFTPTYLLKLALAQELNGDTNGAVASYDRILKNHWDSAEKADAQKRKAILAPNAE